MRIARINLSDKKLLFFYQKDVTFRKKSTIFRKKIMNKTQKKGMTFYIKKCYFSEKTVLLCIIFLKVTRLLFFKKKVILICQK